MISFIIISYSIAILSLFVGAHEIRRLLGQDIMTFAQRTEIQSSLDKFYMSRIGIRMLIGQYLSLRAPPQSPDMIGLVSQKASPYRIAIEAIQDATYMCTRTHGDAPEVVLYNK